MLKTKMRIDESGEWVRCGNCGRKLFKVNKNTKIDNIDMEIKCHSCKTININGLKQFNAKINA